MPSVIYSVRGRKFFGASIAFAPWAHHADRKYCMFYTYFENGKNKHITVHSEEDNYNYFEFDWYKHADACAPIVGKILRQSSEKSCFICLDGVYERPYRRQDGVCVVPIGCLKN